jgi:simple sugar transport system permease protein
VPAEWLPRFEARVEPSAAMRWLSPLLAVALTAIGGFVLFAALGRDPVEGLKVFFVNPVRDLYAVTELLLKATPLMLIGAGLAIGFRANVWNIGAEGQFVIGAAAASGVALLAQDGAGAWLLVAMVLAGALGGAAWGAIPALLRTRFNASEILVSLMLVYIAQLLVSWLVHGPWKDPDGFNFPQTAMFGDAALLPVLVEGTRLTVAFPLAILLLLAAWLFIARSFAGFRMLVVGQAEAAARYAGFSLGRTVWIGMLSGGAAAGVAGAAEVAGPMGQLTEHVSSQYGFAAIIVAFVGRLHPVGVFLASLLMAMLYIGGEQAQQYLNLPSSISKVFQGMLLFFLLAADVFVHYRLRRARVAAPAAAAAAAPAPGVGGTG